MIFSPRRSARPPRRTETSCRACTRHPRYLIGHALGRRAPIFSFRSVRNCGLRASTFRADRNFTVRRETRAGRPKKKKNFHVPATLLPLRRRRSNFRSSRGRPRVHGILQSDRRYSGRAPIASSFPTFFPARKLTRRNSRLELFHRRRDGCYDAALPARSRVPPPREY